MEVNIKFTVNDDVCKKAADYKVTAHQYILSDLETYTKDLKNLSITTDGEPFIQINIDLHGILKVIGGLFYLINNLKSKTLLLVDEGASYLLFRVDEKKAIFCGGLNGTELHRFLETKPGGSFRYYKRVYHKLYMTEVQKLVDPAIVYYYDTEEVDNPRKIKQ